MMKLFKPSQLSLLLLVLSSARVHAQSDDAREGWSQSAASLLRRLLIEKGQQAEPFLAEDQEPIRRRLGGCADVVINFDSDDSDSPLAPGMYVSNEWSKYGLSLSASGGLGTLPRLFDSSEPIGDRDLGAPNNRCTPPGPGVGEGGEPGTPGENCSPLGNVLIIQEVNDDPSVPDDQRGGGAIVFDFNEPINYFYEIGLLDIDKPNSTITVVFENSIGDLEEKEIPIPELGDNSKQTLPINIANVLKLTLNLKDSGAVTYIRFCDSATPTAAPVSPPTSPPPTDECIRTIVDFLTTADGTPIPGGAYVENEWNEFGLTMSSTGGLGSVPRVFNTSDVGVSGSGYGDRDLGTPNEKCTPSGPGEGAGGEPGKPGENCEFQGNVLIIQENNDNPSVPDDNRDGGMIVFNFDPPATYVYSMGLLDIDEPTSVTIIYDNNSEVTLTVQQLGDNSFQDFPINIANVNRVTLNLERSGAVTYIDFCYPTPNGKVKGTVFEDANNNGKQDPGEPAIQGVDVVITDSQGNVITLTRPSVPIQRLSMFLLEELPLTLMDTTSQQKHRQSPQQKHQQSPQQKHQQSHRQKHRQSHQHRLLPNCQHLAVQHLQLPRQRPAQPLVQRQHPHLHLLARSRELSSRMPTTMANKILVSQALAVSMLSLPTAKATS